MLISEHTAFIALETLSVDLRSDILAYFTEKWDGPQNKLEEDLWSFWTSNVWRYGGDIVHLFAALSAGYVGLNKFGGIKELGGWLCGYSPEEMKKVFPDTELFLYYMSEDGMEKLI